MNPYKEAAPWARLITLLILGATVIYAIGRWDARLDRESERLEQDTESLLAAIRSGRGWRDSIQSLVDSLASVQDSLRVTDSTLTASLVANRELADREVEELESTPLDSLLRDLRLQPIRLPPPDIRVVYAADSGGVRFLARRMLRLAQAERELLTVRALADTRANRLTVLQASLGALQADRDTVAAELALAAPLLERWQSHNDCRILMLVRCPSRTTSLLIGLVAGSVTAFAITRE